MPRKERVEGAFPKDLGGCRKSPPPSPLPLPLFLLTSHSQLFPRKCRAAFPTLETGGQPVEHSSRPCINSDFSQMSVKMRFNYTVKKNPEEVYLLLSRGKLDEGSQGLQIGIRDPSTFLLSALPSPCSRVCHSFS